MQKKEIEEFSKAGASVGGGESKPNKSAKPNKIVITGGALGDGKEIVLDLDDIKCVQPGFLTRTLLWLVPRWGVARLEREMGYPSTRAVEKMHELLKKTQRVDVLPAVGGGRGFQIVLDGGLSLYFFQDGDHFVYDGFELGVYERGDVTLFDGAREGWGAWDESQWGEE